ncbi:undecaprenyl/decaprenyl-phosphate alpha-N-acetylglucosaminyl 1-phosphate transferase [Pelagibacterales bacterium SAG-MED35]|nr:undecaprenyl/decaprenyl-phosphate alpha-N-acetylglucosaminyl 1-phosphate transferase [Pelagibacterales bacterium SAG-MED35]
MLNYFLFTILYIIILVIIIFISKKLQFYDSPNDRKLHKKKITNTAGIALYIYLAILATNFEFSYEIDQIIIVGSAIVLTGFLDDRINLTPGVKLIMILLPTGYLIFNGYLITDLGKYELIGKIELGKFGIVFTFLSVGLLLNSYNYIDGIDGLLSGITISGICYLIILESSININFILSLFIIPLLVNLFFNYLPSSNYFKVFTGDAGSLLIGFFISFLLIFFYISRGVHPAFLIWVCWYPVYDFLYVTLYRIVKGDKFYKADKLHFHHIILKKMNNSHFKAFLFINLLNIFVIFVGFQITNGIGKIYSLILFVLLFYIFIVSRNKLNNPN